MRKNVLYIGGFQLPDKNAASHRVVANAKILRDLGYNIIFLNSIISTTPKNMIIKKYFDFKCYEYYSVSKISYLYNISIIKDLSEINDIDIIIAYNYPSIALAKLNNFCKNNNIICIADCTEWYQASGPFLFRLIKYIDTELRMRVIHKKMDAILVISEFLYQFYRKKIKTLKIPPLVDLSESKWMETSGVINDEVVNFVYAGSPSKEKERLDCIIETFNNYNGSEQVLLNIIGITKEQYMDIYGKRCKDINVRFYGKLGNSDVISMIKQANWTIILRDNSRVVKAGFPTKLVESISCGTPVIVNKFSNICDYLDNDNSFVIENVENFSIQTINEVLGNKKRIDNTIFDYKEYINIVRDFMDSIEMNS